jgi:Uma2 family endonuclease
MADIVKTHMTAAEFLALPETNQPTQLIDGEIIVSPSPVPVHQRVVLKSARVLESLIPDGEVFVSPIDVYLDESNVVQPDILWIAAGGKCVVGEKYLSGPPDLIVEVLSPSTAREDRTVKFLLYEKFGVREYWMVDPAKLIEVWVLDGGRFVRQGIYKIDEMFNSPVLSGKIVVVKTIFDF